MEAVCTCRLLHSLEVYAPGDVGSTGKEVQDSGNHQIKVDGGKLFRFEYGVCM